MQGIDDQQRIERRNVKIFIDVFGNETIVQRNNIARHDAPAFEQFQTQSAMLLNSGALVWL